MKFLKHNIEEQIKADLEKKMVFISGPRQVGKTTLAKKIIKEKKGLYLLFDDVEDRRKILNKNYFLEKYVCLDELHKYNHWKNYLKGIYDKYNENLHIVVTGSARLDVYQKSGDSLFGRYFLHNLHPLSLAEINKQKIVLPENLLVPHKKLDGLVELLKFSGFPEPFFSASETEHRRWSNQRQQLLIKEELRELTQIQLLAMVENLWLMLPERIGSLLSFNALAEDLRVSIATLQNWMKIFEKLYFVYNIKPYSTKISRSIQKRSKYYLWDWSQIPDEGARFENLAAGHLFKAVNIWRNLGLANADLFFLRDRNGREVDFLVTKDNKPWFLVEVKLTEERVSPSLNYFSKHFLVPGIQIVKKPDTYRNFGNIAVISAEKWLGHLT